MSAPLRRRWARHDWDLHYGPNMTPMVDVVMVILVFFMASASVLGPEWWIKTALPTPAASPMPAAPDEKPRLVRVALSREDAGTVAAIDGNSPIGIAEIDARLKQLQADAPPAGLVVLITPDADVPYEDVVAAHDAAYRAGVGKVGLMSAPPR